MSCQAAKGKLPKEERCKQNDNWSGAPEMSTLPLPIFWPGLGVNFHILLTQNWLWESSLSLLSLWCILFQIKLGLFRENLNLKKHLRPKNGWSTPSTFWHRLIYIYIYTFTHMHDLGNTHTYMHTHKLHTLVYNILPPTTTITDYTTGLKNCQLTTQTLFFPL